MEVSSTSVDLYNTIDTLDDPQPVWNKPSTIIGITASSLGVATICILLRLYTRLRVVRSPGWDDWFVTMYLLTGIMAGVSLCISTEFGNGEHLLELVYQPERLHQFLKTFYVCNAAITMSITMIKMALLFQYLRVYEKGRSRLACLVALALISAVGLAYTVLAWVPCWPISDFWDFDYKTASDKNCWAFGSPDHDQLYHTYLSWTIINLVSDLVMLCLPIPMFFNNKTLQKTKRGLVGLVVLGAIANALGLWRLVETIRSRAGTYPLFDPPWNAPIIMVLGILELNLASICASVPVFWPVLTAQIERIMVTHEISVTSSNRHSIMHHLYPDGISHHHHKGDGGVGNGGGGGGGAAIWDGSDMDSDLEKLNRAVSSAATSSGPAPAPPAWQWQSVFGGRGGTSRSSNSGSKDGARFTQRSRDQSVSSMASTVRATSSRSSGSSTCCGADLEKGNGNGSGNVLQQHHLRHYEDRYIMGQVDPLRRDHGYVTESEVVALAKVKTGPR